MLPLLSAAALSLAAQTATAAPLDSHVVGDLCTVPANWSPPSTHVYQLKNGATLIFVAVDHVHDVNSTTEQQIKAAFDRYKPTMVLVEGGANHWLALKDYLASISKSSS